MDIKITYKEETGRAVYTALTVSVKTNGENHLLETILIQEYMENPESRSSEVTEFEWVTPEPENGERVIIEKAAEEYILKHF